MKILLITVDTLLPGLTLSCQAEVLHFSMQINTVLQNRYYLQVDMDSFSKLMIFTTVALYEMTSNGQPFMVDD